MKTIPEETVAPATPARVTSDVPKTKLATAKNPGRVASGKRLAEHNRLVREAKKKAEAQKPPTTTITDASATNNITNTTEQSSSTNTGYFILTVGGLIASALGVYYQREAIMRTLGRSQKNQTTQPAPAESNTVVEEPKRKKRSWNTFKSYIYTP